MPQDVWNSELQDVLDKASVSLNYSIDHVVEIRAEVRRVVEDLEKELETLKLEVVEVIEANDSVGIAYRKARVNLAQAAERQDNAAQAKAYEEAEHYMKLKGSFEERERNLRRRRDEVEREKVRLERILTRSEETMSKLRLAMEILKNRLEDMNQLGTERDYKMVALALRFAEQENLRLARDIHDGPAQQCSGAILLLDHMQKNLQLGRGEQAFQEADRLREQLKDALGEFRTFLLRLKPVGLDLSLEKGLSRLAETLKERYGVEIAVTLQGRPDSLPSMLRVNLYRIVQEATMNAIRHGRARKVQILGSFGAETVSLKVVDDGIGFDVHAEHVKAQERGSYGLTNMEERARFAGGSFRIESAPGRGTIVSLSVPVGEV